MKKRLIIVIIVIILFLALFIFSKSMKEEAKEERTPQPQDNIRVEDINEYPDLESDDDVFNEIDNALNYAE